MKKSDTGYCTAEFCTNKHHGNGYCSTHNYGFTNYGDPFINKKRLPISNLLRKELRRLSKKKYKKTIKGKQSEKRYQTTDKYKQVVRRLNKKRTAAKLFWAKNTKKGRESSNRASKKRRLLLRNATPNWVDKSKLYSIYYNCPKGYHVDHIVPLNGKNVSGLHVPWNLQYLPVSDNIRKGNKF